jgi:hypothetical protein
MNFFQSYIPGASLNRRLLVYQPRKPGLYTSLGTRLLAYETYRPRFDARI